MTNEWIKLAQLEQEVNKLFGPQGANVVVDFDMQKIYLAVWISNANAESKLNQYLTENYKAVKISHVLRNEEYRHYFSSRKIDNSKIREVCREKLLEDQCV